VDRPHPTNKIYVINQGDRFDPARNPDYLHWPIADGAPRDSEGKPLLAGSSTVWCVFNDFPKDTTLSDTPVAGLEVQMSAWAHDRPDRLGDVLFYRFKMINKSGEDITDAYTGIWADPFIGFGTQRLGCDPELSMGFGYKKTDQKLGANPPAIGYKIVQGPVVRAAGNTAWVSGRKIPGFLNLGLTALWKYINAGPPRNQEPNNGQEVMFNMTGFDRWGTPLIDPTTGQPTTYWHAGDPIAETGWLDSSAENNRFLMSSGPFELADGDTQEIAIAVIVQQGDSGLDSVVRLKQTAEVAQLLYQEFKETHFGSPEPQVPDFFELFQNYPNPFNPSTSIRYNLAEEIGVTLKIYDILGREVVTLVNELQPAGEYEVVWQSQTQASGIYIYRLKTSNFTLIRKMLLLQ